MGVERGEDPGGDELRYQTSGHGSSKQTVDRSPELLPLVATVANRVSSNELLFSNDDRYRRRPRVGRDRSRIAPGLSPWHRLTRCAPRDRHTTAQRRYEATSRIRERKHTLQRADCLPIIARYNVSRKLVHFTA